MNYSNVNLRKFRLYASLFRNNFHILKNEGHKMWLVYKHACSSQFVLQGAYKAQELKNSQLFEPSVVRVMAQAVSRL
jgi:hypothetical protein